MKGNNYIGLANAIEDNYRGVEITRQVMSEILGKTEFNFSAVVACLNSQLSENGLKLVNKRGYYILVDIPYPEQLAKGTPYTERPTTALKGIDGAYEQAETEMPAAKAHAAEEVAPPKPDAMSLKVSELIGELKRRPELIPGFNDLIAPLGKKLVVVGVRLELI